MTSLEYIFDNRDRYDALLYADSGIDERFVLNAPPGIETFVRLVSPAASPFLETMAQRSQQITWERFGKVIRLYAPLYISNECINACEYCGFNVRHRFERKTLTMDAIKADAEILLKKGIRHLLIVSGEAPHVVTPEVICEIARELHDYLPSLSVEVSPFSTDEYKQLVDGGIEGLAVYQETYNRELYKKVHPAGKKSDFEWRLGTPERGAAAGMRHVSLAALLGLDSDWRKDVLSVALHVNWLMKNYWRTKYSISLPRLCECEGGYQPGCEVSDSELAQLIFAYRIAFPDLGLNLSTRENEKLRDGLVQCGITHLSSESATDPGGYANPTEEIEGKQFVKTDKRSTADIQAMLIAKGLEPVWKDWDSAIV